MHQNKQPKGFKQDFRGPNVLKGSYNAHFPQVDIII